MKYIEKNLKKKALQELLNDVKQNCQSFSIVRYYEGYMTPLEYELMQKEFKDKILQEHQQRLEDYQKNRNGYRDELDSLFHFFNEQECIDYFDELLKQELDVCEACQYCEFENYPQEQIDISSDYFIKRELTRVTPIISGPVFEMLTFSIEGFDMLESVMKKLFSTYKIFDNEYENLCCYRDGQPVLRICSREKYAIVEDM